MSGITYQNGHLILGGCAYMLHKEPVRSNTLAPGASFAFGVTVYQFFKGDWSAGFERFKAYMNRRGHGLQEGYSPEVQWNVLFDLGDGHWSRKQMLEQAALAKDIGCTRLYLDPGWQTSLGSAEWGEQRLGNLKDLVKLLKSKYGLELGLWTASSVGSSYTLRPYCMKVGKPRDTSEMLSQEVPAIREGYQNLCLRMGVKATASSVLADGAIPMHQIDHLIDGWYGNGNSWIAKGKSAWVEVDLGAVEKISRIIVGNDRTGKYTDRKADKLRVLVAEEHSPDSSSSHWQEVFSSTNAEVIANNQIIEFAPRKARWVRVEVEGWPEVRIDEIEVYPPDPVPKDKQLAVEISLRRGPAPAKASVGVATCLSHKRFREARRDRIFKVSEAGIHFWMFDFHGWTGPCYGEDHGHSVPSTTQDHIDSIYGLAREVRTEFPQIRIEMHDAIWPWGTRYLPGYFRQGLSGNGDYDENWGFEFMWNSIEDIKSGRALALYYYNLAYDIPMYCHIDMKADNDYGLSFWWMASTLRHLGIGGSSLKRTMQPHGIVPDTGMDKRYALYKKCMVTYNRLSPYFKKGEFKGIHGDPSLHLHTLKNRLGGVLLVFNLSDRPVTREIRVPASSIYANPGDAIPSNGFDTHWEEDDLVFEIELEPWQPKLVALGDAIEPCPGK